MAVEREIAIAPADSGRTSHVSSRETGALSLVLVVVAAVAWWSTIAAPMPLALPSFLLGWVV